MMLNRYYNDDVSIDDEKSTLGFKFTDVAKDAVNFMLLFPWQSGYTFHIDSDIGEVEINRKNYDGHPDDPCDLIVCTVKLNQHVLRGAKRTVLVLDQSAIDSSNFKISEI